jgi:hypothetical protein
VRVSDNQPSSSACGNRGVSKAEADKLRPEFFRLPSKGGDPYFGLTRSFYYEAEKRGYWRLVRLRDRGKLRGVTLVPFDAVAAFIRQQMEANSLGINKL